MGKSFKENLEVDIAKYVKGKPLVCDHLARNSAQALVGLKKKKNRKYSFDLVIDNLIFNWLAYSISFEGHHKIPLPEELKRKKFVDGVVPTLILLIITLFLETKFKI